MAVFLPTWKIGLPEETALYLKYLKSLSFLEFFDTKATLNSLNTQVNSAAIKIGLKKEDSKPDSPTDSDENKLRNLEEIDDEDEITFAGEKDKSSLMDNMAIMILIGIVLIFVLLILLMIRPIIYCDYRIYRFYALAKQKIFYNMFIRYALQSSLKFEMAGAIAIVNT